MVYPVNPSFTMKSGVLSGPIFHGHVILMLQPKVLLKYEKLSEHYACCISIHLLNASGFENKGSEQSM